MIEQDKIAFKDMLNAVLTIYQKPVLYLDNEEDLNAMRAWFATLQKFEFKQVANAFEKWVETSKFCPTPKEIIELCNKKPVEYTALPKPALSKDQNKAHADNVVKFIQDHSPQEDKKLKDMRAWAHRIIANPKNYPAISLQFAKEALNAN